MNPPPRCSSDFLAVICTIGRSWAARGGLVPARQGRRSSAAAGRRGQVCSSEDGDDGQPPPASPTLVSYFSESSTPAIAPPPSSTPSSSPCLQRCPQMTGWAWCDGSDPTSGQEGGAEAWWGATEGVRRARERNAGEEVDLALEAGWEEGRGLGLGWGWDEAML
jgi:hypothetical protein